MHPAFRQYFLATCPVLIGKQLLPLQVGHCALLEASGNAFLAGGEITRAHVLEVVLVCSRDATDAMRIYRNGWRSNVWDWFAWGRRAKESDIDAARVQLSKYFADHMTTPDRWLQGASAGPRAPWQFCVAHRLAGGDMDSSAKAWNTPLIEATCWMITEDVRAGDDTIVSEAEEIAREALREQANADKPS